MGTHPIFESDFDCLTVKYGAQVDMKESQLYWNSQFIDKTVSFYPKPKISPDERPEIQAHLAESEKQQLNSLHRGHLGIPEEILKAGASQYATMCSNINNKFMLCKQETHGDPRACLKLGNAVSDCAGEFFREALNRCNKELLDYSDCMEQDPRRRPVFCRRVQLAWDKCALEKLGLDKQFWTSAAGPVVEGAVPEKPKNPLQLKPTVRMDDPVEVKF